MTIACLDEERMASWALGEASDQEVADHLDSCAVCRRQADCLRSMASMFRKDEPSTLRGAIETPAASEALPPAEADTPRPTMIGKYFVVGELGKGGQAKVYRALHPQLNRDVAIKWSEAPVSGKEVEARLADEAKLLAQLDDSRILRIYDLDVWLGRPFLVMEYVRGCDLDQLADQRPIEPLEAARLVAEVAKAADVAHRIGITHQDIKPHNILIDEQGKPRLADFGIARLRDIWHNPAEQPVGGTPAYMAPEQWEGEPAKISSKADIFALGGVLFRLLTGKHPRSTATESNPPIPMMQGLNEQLLDGSAASASLKRICRKALAHRPEDRFASAAEMAEALEAACRHSAAGKVIRRILTASACVVALTLGILAFRNEKDSPKPIGVAVPTPQKPAMLSGLSLRLLREGKMETPSTKEDFDRLLPFREKDRLGLDVTLPPGMQARIVALNWSAWPKFEVVEPGRTVERDGKATLEGLLPLERSPDTEVLFAVGTAGEAPGLPSIQAALASLTWSVERRPQLPGNIVVELTSESVQGVRAVFGAPKQDDERVLRDGLESMRAALRARFPFVAGIALPHLPKEAAEAMRRAGPKTSPTAEDNSVRNPEESSDRKMLDKVVGRLLAVERVRKGYPAKFAWPPAYTFSERGGEVNAYATASPQLGAVKDADSGKIRPILIVTEGFMKKIVQGDEHVLAGVLGHEMAHLLLDHVSSAHRLDEAIPSSFNRDEEIQADLEGVKVAVGAGYKYRDGIEYAFRLKDRLGGVSSFEALKGTHPSWNDRLALLDREHASIWKATSAYQNGVVFLHLEQYKVAESCFQRVVEDFPECAEAWTNLGYAQLMQYCDALTTEDLRQLGIGQLAIGGFYERPPTLIQRGGADVWKLAVKNLETALRKDEQAFLPAANLAIAFLAPPDNQPNLAESAKYFELAKRRLGNDKGLSDVHLAAFHLNRSVTEMRRGDRKAADRALADARSFIDRVRSPAFSHLADAVDYGDAMLFADAAPDQRRYAFEILERLLLSPTGGTAWRPLAKEKYESLAKALGETAKDVDALRAKGRRAALRMVASIPLPHGGQLALSDDLQDVLKKTGADASRHIPMFPSSKAKRYIDVSPGVDVVGAEQILAICLTDPKAPPLIVQGRGLGAAKTELHVGMPSEDLFSLLKTQQTDRSLRSIDDPAVQYRYFPALGLAVRMKEGRVAELVLCQIPEKAVD